MRTEPRSTTSARRLEGLGFALTAIIPGAYVLARTFRHVSAALGAYFTLGGLGGVAGPWLYVLAAHTPGGWRGYWSLLAALSLALGALAALVTREGAIAATEPAAVEATAPPRPPIFRTTRAWRVREALASWPFWVIVSAYTANLLCEGDGQQRLGGASDRARRGGDDGRCGAQPAGSGQRRRARRRRLARRAGRSAPTGDGGAGAAGGRPARPHGRAKRRRHRRLRPDGRRRIWLEPTWRRRCCC